MKKMKKLTAVLMAVTMAAGLLAGCGGQTGAGAPAETGKAVSYTHLTLPTTSRV